jgi:hypothetical protein
VVIFNGMLSEALLEANDLRRRLRGWKTAPLEASRWQHHFISRTWNTFQRLSSIWVLEDLQRKNVTKNSQPWCDISSCRYVGSMHITA